MTRMWVIHITIHGIMIHGIMIPGIPDLILVSPLVGVMVAFTRALVLDGDTHIMDMVTRIMDMATHIMDMAIHIMDVAILIMAMATLITHMTIIIMDTLMKVIPMEEEIHGMDTIMEMNTQVIRVVRIAEQ